MTGRSVDSGAGQLRMLGALLLAPMLAHGQAVDTSGWECKFCQTVPDHRVSNHH